MCRRSALSRKAFAVARGVSGMEDVILDDEGMLSPVVVVATVLLIAGFAIGLLYQLILLLL
ncbi:hypothetical protein AArcCO_1747 [Halalkaliarchaeum sp. AArc-CO]|nr:hypothetical protein AArcCO_1747 [Halalkaliarchaeum sp. AArc-CO]